jgi:quercetin dioxygenase-like cupin family protein
MPIIGPNPKAMHALNAESAVVTCAMSAVRNHDDAQANAGSNCGVAGVTAGPAVTRVSATTIPTTGSSQTMELKRSGSQPSGKGPAEYFTGSVRVDAPFQGSAPARVSGATVTFEPGARTAWHTHPLGQTLIVISGCGWVQREGGPIEEIRPGDIVWFPPGEKHWHGATPTTAMTHIAIVEQLDGKSADWLEHVSAEQYRRPNRP